MRDNKVMVITFYESYTTFRAAFDRCHLVTFRLELPLIASIYLALLGARSMVQLFVSIFIYSPTIILFSF
jgi:hypothetical protein